MDVELEGGVVALFGVVEVNEEEDVGPDVMFLVDVVFKALRQHTTHKLPCERQVDDDAGHAIKYDVKIIKSMK